MSAVLSAELPSAAAAPRHPSSPLDRLPLGQMATVAGLRSDDPVADAAMLMRLAELGFLPGEPVRLLRRGPGGREPLAVQVGDTLFALRLVEAACVQVQADEVPAT